ncbi:MAG: N-acyl-D-amino-acid deacylase family protein [Bacillota bacterium]
MYDVIFRNARIVDGTGAPWFYGEVAVLGDEIREAAYKIDARAVREIDCKGMVLAPGFIDAHSHSDSCWFLDKRGESKLRQGVTTEVTGQCGDSPAPVTERRRSVEAPEEGVENSWSTFGEYLSALEQNGVGLNVVPLVGHGALRSCAMGYGARCPSEEELRHMKDLLVEALRSGAFGFSSGLIYPPSSFADTEELIELAKAMSVYGGIYATHMRNEGTKLLESVEESIRIGREGKVPVHISHHKATGKAAWGLVNQSLAMIDEARSQGVDVTCDQYPYVASATSFKSIIPLWAHEGGPQALLARLKDPETCARLKQEVQDYQGPIDGWSKMLITDVAGEKYKFAEGKRIPEIAAVLGLSEVDAALKLLIDEELQVRYAHFGMCEEDVKTVMAHPAVMIGSDSSCRAIDGPLSKGKPHPRTFGTFPRVLSRYVREEKVLALENAVFKMTGMPAARMGLWDRGLIRPGMKADITVFDPDTIIDKATFENPSQYPVGIPYVMLNGVMVVEEGDTTGKIAGRVIRRK